MWLFHFFMNKTASAVQNARLSAHSTDEEHSRSTRDKKRYFNTYPQVANFLLRKYGTDEVIAKSECDIMRFAQPSNMTPSPYAEKLVTKTLQSGDLYEEYVLNETFLKGLDASIRNSMREY